MLYRNANTRLVYLHLCLRSGYHDADRDLLKIPIRRLADDIGITLSAARNAISMLTQYGLLSYENGVFCVKKFVVSEMITKRATSKKQEQARAKREQEQRAQVQREIEYEDNARRIDELHRIGKTPFMVYYESLQAKAAQGDADALASLKRHKSTYEMHKAQIENEHKPK